MYPVAIVRYGIVAETFTVKSLTMFAIKLQYIRKFTKDGVTFFVMAEKDDYITSLSTGNVGKITKGLG